MNYPTPFPAANALIDTLHQNARTILGKQFVGLYLYGSLATGGFNPKRSDIDFIIVTETILPDDMIKQLEAAHHAIINQGTYLSGRLEGTYIPRADFRRYDFAAGPFPFVNEGHFYLSGHGHDWIIQRHTVLTCGAVVSGPPPSELIDPISAEMLRGAVHNILDTWWIPIIDDPVYLKNREYEAFGTLSLCRCFYLLETGNNSSKEAAARWTQSTVDAQWHDHIERAIIWPAGEQPEELETTVAFMRMIIGRIGIG